MSLNLELSWEGHRVRMVGTPERPEWIAKDVCRVLHIHNSSDALWRAGVTPAERGSVSTETLGGPQAVTTVTEPGLWKLVLISRKPAAARFKHWLATEVLPSIRKYGCYPPPPAGLIVTLPDLRDPKQLAAVAVQLYELVVEKDATIAVLTPKAEAHDRLAAADGSVCLMDAGRILGRPPVLFVDLLEADGILFRNGDGKLLPRYQWRQAGYFLVCCPEVNGKIRVQTVVSPSGLQWLARRYPRQDRPGDVAIVPVRHATHSQAQSASAPTSVEQPRSAAETEGEALGRARAGYVEGEAGGRGEPR